jgi:hypothetical protein
MPTTKKKSKKATKKVAKKKIKKRVSSKKKTAAKKGGRKAKSKALVCVDGEHCFWTTDGQILASLIDLEASLEKMRDKVFNYHVTKEKNDFAEWVESALGDRELADALRRSKKASTARTVVVRRLKIYDL